MRAMCFASLCALRTGLNILTADEGGVIDEIRAHGGFFKIGDTGQRLMPAALDMPVGIQETAAEGGALGMALLAGCHARGLAVLRAAVGSTLKVQASSP